MDVWLFPPFNYCEQSFYGILIQIFVWISISNIFHTYIAWNAWVTSFSFLSRIILLSAQHSSGFPGRMKAKMFTIPCKVPSRSDFYNFSSTGLAHFAHSQLPPYWSSGTQWCPIPGLCTWLFCLELSSLLPSLPPASVQITTLFKTEHTSPLPRCVVLHLT